MTRLVQKENFLVQNSIFTSWEHPLPSVIFPALDCADVML